MLNWAHPWLASVYTDKESRGLGVGKVACLEVLKEANLRGFEKTYLFTPDQEEWYERQGWVLISKEEYNGKIVSVMSFTLKNIKHK